MDVRVALAQIAVSADKRANLEKVVAAAERAARESARLVVFPEASMYPFGKPTDPLAPFAEPLDGPFVSALSRIARDKHMWILAGIFEKIEDDERVYNTLVLLNNAGELAGSYRKIHLYDAFGYMESNRIAAGDGSTLQFEVDGFRFGAMTCYDLRFPELARHLVKTGSQALLLPAAWLHGVLKEFHLETLVRARAIENTVYFGCADQCGPGLSANSMLVDPMGTTAMALAEAEGVITATLRVDRLKVAREKNPSLHHTRPDLYARWIEEEDRALLSAL